MKVYLDNCCYNRPYDDQTNLRIQIESQAKLAVQREPFDYTKWQREHFDNMDLHTFLSNAVEYAKAQGK